MSDRLVLNSNEVVLLRVDWENRVVEYAQFSGRGALAKARAAQEYCELHEPYYTYGIVGSVKEPVAP